MSRNPCPAFSDCELLLVALHYDSPTALQLRLLRYWSKYILMTAAEFIELLRLLLLQLVVVILVLALYSSL